MAILTISNFAQSEARTPTANCGSIRSWGRAGVVENVGQITMARTDSERWEEAAADARRICRNPALPPAVAGALGAGTAFLVVGVFWALDGLGHDLGFRSPGFATLTTCALGFAIPFGAIWFTRRRYQAELQRAYDHLVLLDKDEAASEARRAERWRRT